MRKIDSVSLVGLVLLLLATPAILTATDMADVEARGEFVMLCFPHSTSEFVRSEGAGYTGLDYEILKTFAAAHRVELKVQPVPAFADLIPWLLEGRGDVIGSAFSITKQRRQKVDYSESYFPVKVMVVVSKGVNLNGPDDLAGKKAAVVPGSSREAFILQKVENVQLVAVPKTRQAYVAVVNGEADYAPVDSTSAMTDLQEFAGLHVAYTFPDRMGYGYAVTKGSDLAAALSEHVKRLKSSGIFYKMLERCFGPNAVELIKSIETQY
jgi:ABC-type amino acid transport substrate-binding protein